MSHNKKDSNFLLKGFKDLALVVDTRQVDKLSAYLELIHKWNKAYNLTAINKISDMQIAHVLDSASCYDFIKGSEILDVGTGAGLPGLVLAILNKNLNVTLLDSNSKKIRFLNQCKIELELDNINPVHCRVENLEKNKKFDTIISRAFASFDDFANNCRELLTTNGILVAMKGKWNESTKYSVTVNRVFVPGLDAKRHIIMYKNHQI